jgi:hypothetical protein
MAEMAQCYELIKDDPDFGMLAGDILACVPYPLDSTKLTVAFRISDGFNPECNVYREQVRRVPGRISIRWREYPPYGAYRA